MTRKDYKLIADAILQARTYALASSTLTTNGVLNYLTGYLGVKLQEDNQRFDHTKFAVATGARKFSDGCQRD